jgi:hypothetical protein
MGITIFDNGQDGATGYYFAKIYNNVKLRSFTIDRYGIDNTVAHALDIQANQTGVELYKIQVNDCGRSTGFFPIEIRSGASVTIEGGGSTCNSIWQLGGGIEVTGNTTVVNINKYSFIGNERSENGVAVKINSGTVNIRNSRFENNTVSGGPRGIVYQSGGTVNIYDCLFDGNNYSYSAGQYGATILVTGGTFYMTRSKVLNTNKTGSSNAYGAGVCFTTETSAVTATIDSCYFAGNTGDRGRDVHVRGASASLTAFNCSFGSTSPQVGTTSSGTITLSDCGNPGVYVNTGSTTKTNTANPTYTANPTTNDYTGNCATLIVLPIELNFFTVTCNGNSHELSWQTESEINNNYFVVEKSTDAIHFIPLTYINGKGNSNSVTNYQYQDLINDIQIIYYRLRQVDFDGVNSVSQIVAISNCKKRTENTSAYWNWQSQALEVDVNLESSGEVKLLLSNLSGQILSVDIYHLEEGQSHIQKKLEQPKTGILLYSIVTAKYSSSGKVLLNNQIR